MSVALTFEQRNLLLGARGPHVCHQRAVITGLRRLGLVTEVFSLRNGNGSCAAKLTPAGEAARAEVVAAFDAAAAKGPLAVLAFRYGQPD